MKFVILPEGQNTLTPGYGKLEERLDRLEGMLAQVLEAVKGNGYHKSVAAEVVEELLKTR